MSPWDVLAWVTSVGLAIIVVMSVGLLVVFTIGRFIRSSRKNSDVE